MLFRSVTARSYASDNNTQLLSPKDPVVSSYSEDGLEYKNVLEYREINRHARRKIREWLNEGWSIEWEWNGKYGGLSEHQMTLRRFDENLPPFPSPSHKKIVLEFPSTHEPGSGLGSASDVDSDSE